MLIKKIFFLCLLVVLSGNTTNRNTLNYKNIVRIRCYYGEFFTVYKMSKDYTLFKKAYHADSAIITSRKTIKLIVENLDKLKKSSFASRDVRCGFEIDFNDKTKDTLIIDYLYVLTHKNVKYELTPTMAKLLKLRDVDVNQFTPKLYS
jgi:hypothetical protein